MTIILKGQPKSTNHIYKYSCHGPHPSMYMNQEGKAVKESYQLQAMAQWAGHPLLECPLTIVVALFFETRRKYDIDNYGKLLLDALTGVVWADDSQIDRMTVSKGYDRQNPRIEITVIPSVGVAQE